MRNFTIPAHRPLALSLPHMTPAQAIHKFKHLRRHTQNGERAVHKPLLTLLLLGRIANGQDAPVTFDAIAPQMKALLEDFGRAGSAKTAHNPFWHMQSDGIWKLEGPAASSADGLSIDYCAAK
jgi:putative restriction endonuclease